MKLHMKLHAFLLACLLVVIVIQFKQVEEIDTADNQKIHALLERIVRLDAVSEEQMMQLYSHDMQNYDKLSAALLELENVYTQLATELHDRPLLHKELANLRVSIEIQVDAVNTFKSDIGILLNSKRYFPTLITELITTHPNWRDKLLRLNRDVFHFLLEPDNAAVKKGVLHQLQTFNTPECEALCRHIKVLLQYAQQVKAAITTVLHCGTPEAANAIAHTFDKIYEAEVKSVEQSRLWLIAMVIFLFTYLSLLLYRLNDAVHKLNDTHHEVLELHEQTNMELQARKAAEIKYRTLVDSSSAAIMTLAKHHFLSANPATLSMFGFDSEKAMCALGPTDISPEYQPGGRTSEEAAQYYIQRAMRKGSCSFEWIHKRSNSDEFPALVQLTVLEIEGEAMIQAVVTDLSDLAHERQEKRLLAEALKYADDAILITDIEARILYANQSFEQMSGYKSREIIGSFVSILRSESIKTSVFESMQKVVNSGRGWKGELPMLCKDGTQKLTERSIAPVYNDANTIVNHVAIFRDVTDEREQATKLEHTQRLESLGILAGGIAHDFNNILTAIMGNAAIASKLSGKQSPVSKQLFRIEEAAERASELCMQMLAYSGKGRFIITPLNLSDLVEKMLRLMEVSIAKNIVLKFHLAENLPAVEADAAQIQQIVMNLITNANEAIGEKSGVISFSTGVMSVDHAYLDSTFAGGPSRLEGRYVYLEVSDTGSGMDNETMDKLFDPFFTTKFTGRGLGMSAVLGIIRSHHGAIKVYSELGKGSTFKVLLPASEQLVVDDSVTTKQASMPTIKGAVLVVDDEETIREVAAMLLEDMGIRVLMAEDGVEAIDIYREHQHDIAAVLLDMTMPRMDGQTCFSELKRINKDVKVILSSGYTEEDVTERFGGKGFSGFIQKPYPPNALEEMLRAVFEQE